MSDSRRQSLGVPDDYNDKGRRTSLKMWVSGLRSPFGSYSELSKPTEANDSAIVPGGSAEFKVKYVGSEVVRGAITSGSQVREIVALVRERESKLRKMLMTVSLEGVVLIDEQTKMVIERHGITTIVGTHHNVHTDKYLTLITHDVSKGIHECHVFYREKTAADLNATMASVFKEAYARYQEDQKEKEQDKKRRASDTSTLSKSMNDLAMGAPSQGARRGSAPSAGCLASARVPSVATIVEDPPSSTQIGGADAKQVSKSFNNLQDMREDDPFTRLAKARSSTSAQAVTSVPLKGSHPSLI
eukprot:Colp12_sorted_trinity150504_noHs@2164